MELFATLIIQHNAAPKDANYEALLFFKKQLSGKPRRNDSYYA